MNLIDPADLPKSAANGPESWGEAWTKLASTTSTAQQMIENTTSDRSMLEDIYARRIAKIEDITGQTLENPIRSELGLPGFLQPPFRAAYTHNEQAFDKRVSTLQQQYPQLATALPETVDDEMNRMRRDAQQASGQAALNPNLDPISRFAAQMAGGLAGAARDPFQWQMAIAGGGGGSAGSSVAGRIGKTMLSEAMLNGGQEAVLQIASQPRKKAAGLEYGLGDALANVGVAATFGALFGGTMEAGHALAGLYRMGDGGAEVAARVLEGRPQPGDVETMAKAIGVELQPEQLQQLNRSFEERVLDDHMIGPDATPEQQRVFEAAKRYAEDPDNNPPPEIVERAIADEQAGPARTLTADDYERIYGGDPDVIDDLRGVMQAESLDDAARIIDDQTRVPSQETVAATAPAVSEPEPVARSAVVQDDGSNVLLKSPQEDAHLSLRRDGENLKVGITSVSKASRGQGKARELYEEAVRLADENGGVLRSDISVSNDALRVYNSLSRRGYDVRRNPDAVRTEKGWIAPDQPGQNWVFEVRPRPDPNVVVDPLEGQMIRPRLAAEPDAADAMRIAEEQAGPLAEPVRDTNGDIINPLDEIPIIDRDGNTRYVSIGEALEIADQGNILADLLEVCQV